MYEKILHSELRFPRHFVPETCSLLSGMLTRKVEDRLGYRGAVDIKSHAFFRGLNWEEIAARKVKPQFTPPANGVDGANDISKHVNTSNFEEEFTAELPVDSVVDKSKLSSTAVEKTHFEGFTYMGEGGALAVPDSIDERDYMEDGDRRESFSGTSN
jgi:serum/glucocorticoid-regulated kinase 2